MQVLDFYQHTFKNIFVVDRAQFKTLMRGPALSLSITIINLIEEWLLVLKVTPTNIVPNVLIFFGEVLPSLEQAALRDGVTGMGLHCNYIHRF